MKISPADRVRALRASRALDEGMKRGDIDFSELTLDDWATYHKLWAQMRDELVARIPLPKAITAHDVSEALRVALQGN